MLTFPNLLIFAFLIAQFLELERVGESEMGGLCPGLTLVSPLGTVGCILSQRQAMSRVNHGSALSPKERNLRGTKESAGARIA